MRVEGYRIEFVLFLVVYPRLYKVGCKNAAFQQEIMVLLQHFQYPVLRNPFVVKLLYIIYKQIKKIIIFSVNNRIMKL